MGAATPPDPLRHHDRQRLDGLFLPRRSTYRLNAFEGLPMGDYFRGKATAPPARFSEPADTSRSRTRTWSSKWLHVVALGFRMQRAGRPAWRQWRSACRCVTRSQQPCRTCCRCSRSSRRPAAAAEPYPRQRTNLARSQGSTSPKHPYARLQRAAASAAPSTQSRSGGLFCALGMCLGYRPVA
jgi:hypothetical protein